MNKFVKNIASLITLFLTTFKGDIFEREKNKEKREQMELRFNELLETLKEGSLVGFCTIIGLPYDYKPEQAKNGGFKSPIDLSAVNVPFMYLFKDFVNVRTNVNEYFGETFMSDLDLFKSDGIFVPITIAFDKITGYFHRVDGNRRNFIFLSYCAFEYVRFGEIKSSKAKRYIEHGLPCNIESKTYKDTNELIAKQTIHGNRSVSLTSQTNYSVVSNLIELNADSKKIQSTISKNSGIAQTVVKKYFELYSSVTDFRNYATNNDLLTDIAKVVENLFVDEKISIDTANWLIENSKPYLLEDFNEAIKQAFELSNKDGKITKKDCQNVGIGVQILPDEQPKEEKLETPTKGVIDNNTALDVLRTKFHEIKDSSDTPIEDLSDLSQDYINSENSEIKDYVLTVINPKILQLQLLEKLNDKTTLEDVKSFKADYVNEIHESGLTEKVNKKIAQLEKEMEIKANEDLIKKANILKSFTSKKFIENFQAVDQQAQETFNKIIEVIDDVFSSNDDLNINEVFESLGSVKQAETEETK